jgi:nucleoside-diphosphate-sugar epimerase
MRPHRVLIAGCGDLGVRIGRCLSAASVYGLRRRVADLPGSLMPVQADLLNGAGFSALPRDIDTLIYAPTPAARTESAYRSIYVDALARLIEALPQPAAELRLIYVSSTAVYGQNAGELVDEHSASVASAFNGQILLQAETLAHASVADCVAVRLSGLYGPDRHWLLRRVQAGEAIANGVHWTNRIHLDDAAALVARLANLARVPACVIGVDDAPVPEHEVLDWMAGRLGLPPLPRRLEPATVSGKRLCNHLSRSLGWQPRYASFQDGYIDVLTSNLQGSAHS